MNLASGGAGPRDQDLLLVLIEQSRRSLFGSGIRSLSLCLENRCRDILKEADAPLYDTHDEKASRKHNRVEGLAFEHRTSSIERIDKV